MNKINKNGFTLIELLAVIVIMGILMAIAIPSINLIITDSRKDIYVNSARTFINEAEKGVLDSTFEIEDPDTTYYIHIANLVDDPTNLGKSGFAPWSDSYVVATMDLINDKTDYNYYFNSSDMAKWKIELVGRDNLKKKDVYQDNDKRINFYPVGERQKIVVYDANGVKVNDQKPYISISEEKAKKCFTYKSLSDTTISITGYKAACGPSVTIPNAIEGKEIVTLDSWSFSNKGLTSVILPDNLKTIGPNAFTDNKLTSLVVPNSVETISSGVFWNNKLSKITLPKELKTIGQSAFRDNELTDPIEILVPGPTTKIGLYAFLNNKIPAKDSFLYKRKTDGTIDYSIITGYTGNFSEFSDNVFRIVGNKNGINLKRIDNLAFADTDMYKGMSVVIPDTVTEIGQWAFSNFEMTSVKLPSNLKSIEHGAFNNNKLTSVTVPNGTEIISSSAFLQNKISKLSLPISLKSIGKEAFRYNELKDGVYKLVPNPSTEIGLYAFLDNKISADDSFLYKRKTDGTIDYSIITGYTGNLSEFSNKVFRIIGNKNGVDLKRIEKLAFADTNIYKGMSVVIPDTVTEIGQWAFSNFGMTSVKLSSNLKSIEGGAFNNNELTTITIPSSVTTIKNGVFSNNNKLTQIINKTGRSFNWRDIADGTNSATFETGTIKTNHGDIIVTK